MSELRPIWLLERGVFDINNSSPLIKSNPAEKIAKYLEENKREFYWIGDGIHTFFDYQQFMLKNVKKSKEIAYNLIIPYGSINMVSNVLGLECNLPITHSILAFDYVNFDDLGCTSYYSHWSEYLLNRNGVFVTLGMFKKNHRYYFDLFDTNRLFIRPNSSKKTFTGCIFNIKKKESPWFDYWFSTFPSETLVVVSPEITNIVLEARVIIGNGKVLGYSEYSRALEVISHTWSIADPVKVTDYRRKCEDFALQMFNIWSPSNLFVLDIAILDNGECKIIEPNGINCANWYNCDVAPIVDELDKQVLKDANALWED